MELDRELEGEDEDEDDEDENEDDEEEDKDEDDETQQARQLLNEEIANLEFAVRKKEGEVASTDNPLIRKRFEDALKKLHADLEVKMGSAFTLSNTSIKCSWTRGTEIDGVETYRT